MKKTKAALAIAGERELFRLRYDHYSRGNFTIMTDSLTVWLTEHPMGQDQIQHFECSRRMFNRLIAEYQKPKKFIRAEYQKPKKFIR